MISGPDWMGDATRRLEMILLVSYTCNHKTGGARHPHRLKENEMNNLNGSEKQIAWATDIRREFIEKTKPT